MRWNRLSTSSPSSTADGSSITISRASRDRDEFDIPAFFTEHVAAPVLVDNDVNLMALGEFDAGWREVRHLLFVKIATGIGAGIASGGRLNRGAQGSAGDLGHVRAVGTSTAECTCGNIGCLEAVAAGPAIAAQLRDRGLDVHSTAGVIELVRAGNVVALQAVRQAGRDLGNVLATCVNLLNPSVIVIGDRLLRPAMLAGVREVVYHRSPPLATQHLRVSRSHTGARAGVRGASAMVIEAVLPRRRSTRTWPAARVSAWRSAPDSPRSRRGIRGRRPSRPDRESVSSRLTPGDQSAGPTRSSPSMTRRATSRTARCWARAW